MLYGVTGQLLGANAEAKKAYHDMISSDSNVPGSIKNPHAWTSPSFSLLEYDLVFLPGGHEKGVRQIIDSKRMHDLLAEYFPLTKRDSTKDKDTDPSGGKNYTIAAICHGVQVLAFTPHPTLSSKSIIHGCTTTALPSYMEQSIFWGTRLFLGDYYKTYGAKSKSVQEFVEDGLDEPRKQFITDSPCVEDKTYRYVSGRYPPDAWGLAKRAVDLVREGMGA